MRNLLAFVGAAVLTFAGLGWYLGWYKLEAAPSSNPGHETVNVDIDAKKVGSDLRHAEQTLHHDLQQVTHADTAKSPLDTGVSTQKSTGR
jgi:hypothetical protein